MRFGEPIYLAEYVAERGFTRETLGFKARVPLLNELCYDVMNRVNNRVTLTAGNIVAGLLMGYPRRGMTQSELKALFVITVRHFHQRKVELAFTEKKLELAMENALESFVQSETLVRATVGGEAVVNIPENKRSEMEYYKNNGIHFILDLSLVCMAFHCLHPNERTLENAGLFGRDVYDLLSQEFLIRGEFPTQDHIAAGFKAMERADALCLDGDRMVYGQYRNGRDLVDINGHMLQNFLESYFVVAETLTEYTGETTQDRKQFLKQCLAKARLLYAVGTIRRQESVNHVTFSNALTRFNKMGLISLRTAKGQKQPGVTVVDKKRDELLELRNKIFTWTQRLN